jgi:hypothetical protein
MCEAIATLGPLRLVSARPLERMIGDVKCSIKSRQMPSKNASNYVTNHFADVYKDKCIATYDKYASRSIVFGKEITSKNYRSMVERFHECYEVEEVAIERVVDIKEKAQVIESYFPIRSGKELKLIGKPSNKVTFVIYSMQTNSERTGYRCIEGTEKLKYGQLLFMYNTEDKNFALVKTIFPVRSNVEQDCHYYYKNAALSYAFEVVLISDIVSYGIEIVSLNEQDVDRINLVWDHV